MNFPIAIDNRAGKLISITSKITDAEVDVLCDPYGAPSEPLRARRSVSFPPLSLSGGTCGILSRTAVRRLLFKTRLKPMATGSEALDGLHIQFRRTYPACKESQTDMGDDSFLQLVLIRPTTRIRTVSASTCEKTTSLTAASRSRSAPPSAMPIRGSPHQLQTPQGSPSGPTHGARHILLGSCRRIEDNGGAQRSPHAPIGQYRPRVFRWRRVCRRRTG